MLRDNVWSCVLWMWRKLFTGIILVSRIKPCHIIPHQQDYYIETLLNCINYFQISDSLKSECLVGLVSWPDQKKFPNLTGDSETETGSEEEETEGYISDREGHQEVEEKDQQDWVSIYFKDWESNNVFQFKKDLTMLHCKSEVTDSDSQCGDDESEEEEEKVQRRKSLPRSKGGAGQWRWQEKMVEIAIQVHSERNYIWLKTFFTGCC